MRAMSQKFPFTCINPFNTILFLLFIMTGCTHFVLKEKSAPPPNIYIERSYFPNGNIEYEAKYINDKLDGLSRVWLEDGTLISKSEYSNGKPHGAWIIFHSNGTMMHEVQYEYGQKHGVEKWYYENGNLKSEQEFDFGISISEITRWNIDGTLIY